MPLPDGSLVLILFWVAGVFILWNLFRFGETFRQTTLMAIMGAATVTLVGGIGYLHFRELRAGQERRAGLLIFPAIEKSAGAATADGLAVAEIIGEYLRQTPNLPFYVIPTETIFAAAQRDSLGYEEYVWRFARATGLPIIGWGVYTAAANAHDGSSVDFKIGEWRKKNAPDVRALNVPPNFKPLPELARDVARAMAQDLAGPHATPPALVWQDQIAAEDLQKYYAAKFDLLAERTEAALAAARRLVLADTSQEHFAGLYVESFLRHYQRRQLDPAAWADSLRLILPMAKRAARDSLHSENARRLGEVYVHLKKWNEAEKALRLAHRRDSTDSKIYLLAAQLHASRWQLWGFRHEVELYQRARALNPLNLAAGLAEADYQWKENRVAAAEKILAQLLRLNPNHVDVLLSRARINPSATDGAKILALYERILAVAPGNAEAYYNLGILYYHQQDFDNAEKFFERAIKLNNHADARLYLASLHERRGNPERAIQYLRERIRLSRGDDDKYAAVAREQLYNILLARGEIPANLRPDSLK